jgi:hypothetical protein
MVTHDDGSLVFVSDRPLLLQAAAEPRLHGNYRDPSQWSEPVTGDDTIDANVELFTRLEELTQRNEKLEKEIAALLALAPAPGVPAADTAPVVADTVPVVTAPDTGGTPVLPWQERRPPPTRLPAQLADCLAKIPHLPFKPWHCADG